MATLKSSWGIRVDILSLYRFAIESSMRDLISISSGREEVSALKAEENAKQETQLNIMMKDLNTFTGLYSDK